MPTIEVSDETLEKIKDQLDPPREIKMANTHSLVGRRWFFRTVTYHIIGEVTHIASGRFAVLKNASWVADSGRFTQAIKDGTLKEVEPTGDHIVNLDTVTDFLPWNHPLPTVQK